MDRGKAQQKWDERQIKYANFVARGKTNLDGERRSEEQFAKAIGVDRSTMWRWTQMDGWAELLMDCSLKYLGSQIPAMNLAIVGKSRGDKRFKDADPKAYQTIMRQYRLLMPDTMDVTTNGKDMPSPILGGITKQDD